MTKAFEWTQERIERVVLLNKTEVLETIAVDLGCCREAVRSKLRWLNIEPFKRAKHNCFNVSTLKPPQEQYRGIFEDHPNADADRHKGRRPSRQVSYSPANSSTALCLG